MEQAIAELRGEPMRPDFEPELRLGIPAYIPDHYVPDENERLILIYGGLARAESEQDLDDLRDEMRDRAPARIPTLVENLIRAMNIRRQMRTMLILSAITKANQLEIRLASRMPHRRCAEADEAGRSQSRSGCG